jgi:hypothetical protein
MGPTGSGKSTLCVSVVCHRLILHGMSFKQIIEFLAPEAPSGVGHGLKSVTFKVNTIRLKSERDNRHYVLVDTPDSTTPLRRMFKFSLLSRTG